MAFDDPLGPDGTAATDCLCGAQARDFAIGRAA